MKIEMKINYAVEILQARLNDELRYAQQAEEFLDGNEGVTASRQEATRAAFKDSWDQAKERIPQLQKAIALLTKPTPL